MRAGGGKDVSLAGGARAAQQYLAAGLVDEMEINLVPTLLGSGGRLFDGVGDNQHGLDLVRTVAAPRVTQLTFAKRWILLMSARFVEQPVAADVATRRR
jgi:dihydrofolate reductase